MRAKKEIIKSGLYAGSTYDEIDKMLGDKARAEIDEMEALEACKNCGGVMGYTPWRILCDCNKGF